MRRQAWVALVVTALAACGGGMAPSEAPKSTSPAPPAYHQETNGTAQPQSNQSTSTPASPEHPGNFAQPPNSARVELDRAQAQVEASMGDCATACRALASMESAAHHICELGGDDSTDCSSARQRVSIARDRVERACGKCR